MKVVINSCFGGFGLSHKAIMKYAELNGFKLYPYLDDISIKIYGNKAVIGNDDLLHHYSKTPIDQLERNKWGSYDHSDDSYFSDRDIKRDDPILIQVIEELGSEVASGKYAKLTIIEIPDDVNWQIAEYDGFEHIAEKHRTWG